MWRPAHSLKRLSLAAVFAALPVLVSAQVWSGTGFEVTPGPCLITSGTFANRPTGANCDRYVQTDGVQTVWLKVGGAWVNTGLGGSVTSVGLALPAQFTVTNSPVTGSGTLTGAWNVQNANKGLFGPTTGADAAPTFRAMVDADLPFGAPAARGAVIVGNSTPAWAKYALGSAGAIFRSDGTDPLWSVTTWPNSLTKGDILHASDANVVTGLADVATGSYLRSGGVSTAPLWSTLILPNAATQYYIPFASATNTWGEDADLTFTGGNTLNSPLAVHSTSVSTPTVITASGTLKLDPAAAAAVTINGGFHVGGTSDPGDNNALVDGTFTSTGLATFNGGITADGGVFTVADATGALHTAGDFDVNTTYFTVAAASGITHVAGNFDVATPKFTVASATGNTHIAGDLDVATPKFTVAAATGNTHVAGDFDVNASYFTVASATGNTDLKGYIGHPSYASQTTNWRVTAAGGADFRYLFTDELRAKLFTVDQESVLTGDWMITKSASTVSQTFVAPAAGATATLWVRDAPTYGDAAVFVSGDTVVLRSMARAVFGEFTIGDCVGVVTAYADGSGADAGQQSWTFTRNANPHEGSMAAKATVAVDQPVLDYGVANNGYWETTAVDGAASVNSPYTQIVTWETAPVAGHKTVRTRFGNLLGITGTANEYGMIAGTYAATNGSFFRASNANFDLHNITAKWWDGATNTIIISPNSAGATASPYISLGSPAPSSYGNNAGIFIGWDHAAAKAKASWYSDATHLFQFDGAAFTLKSNTVIIDDSGIRLTSPQTTMQGVYAYTWNNANVSDVGQLGTYASSTTPPYTKNLWLYSAVSGVAGTATTGIRADGTGGANAYAQLAVSGGAGSATDGDISGYAQHATTFNTPWFDILQVGANLKVRLYEQGTHEDYLHFVRYDPSIGWAHTCVGIGEATNSFLITNGNGTDCVAPTYLSITPASGEAAFYGSLAWGGGAAIASSSKVALLDAANTFTNAGATSFAGNVRLTNASGASVYAHDGGAYHPLGLQGSYVYFYKTNDVVGMTFDGSTGAITVSGSEQINLAESDTPGAGSLKLMRDDTVRGWAVRQGLYHGLQFDYWDGSVWANRFQISAVGNVYVDPGGLTVSGVVKLSNLVGGSGYIVCAAADGTLSTAQKVCP